MPKPTPSTKHPATASPSSQFTRCAIDAATAERLAGAVIEAADAACRLPLPSASIPGFGAAEAYAVSRAVLARRQAAGWMPLGRKIGFTNRTIWPRYGVDGPIWAHVYDRTVEFAAQDRAVVSLTGLSQPRLEPEIAVRFRTAPGADDPESLLAAIEWIAPTFELVQCHFDEWKFTGADTVADLALHGRLVVGAPVPVGELEPAQWLARLSDTSVTLRRGDAIVDRGHSSNVLGGPLQALGYLVRTLREQPAFAPIGAGEIVTTGTITDAQTVMPGETWRSRYVGVPLAGLGVEFVA